MIENIEIILTLLGGFIAVISLQLSLRGDIKDIRDRSDEKDEQINEKLAAIQREFDLCRYHCKTKPSLGGLDE